MAEVSERRVGQRLDDFRLIRVYELVLGENKNISVKMSPTEMSRTYFVFSEMSLRCVRHFVILPFVRTIVGERGSLEIAKMVKCQNGKIAK